MQKPDFSLGSGKKNCSTALLDVLRGHMLDVPSEHPVCIYSVYVASSVLITVAQHNMCSCEQEMFVMLTEACNVEMSYTLCSLSLVRHAIFPATSVV